MNPEFERMNKPREIEEWLDTYGWRRLGYLIVQAVRDRPWITPNQLSLASTASALLAAAAYYHRTLAGALLGLVGIVLVSSFDAADGQLARATGRGSPYGRLIDGLCDNVSFIAIYVSILLSWLAATGASPWLPVALALAAGLSHSVQSSLVEYQRTLFLYYCHGSSTPVAEQPEALRERHRRAREEGRSREAFLLRLWLAYALQQRGLLASGDRLQRRHERAVREDPGLRERFAAAYRAANQRLVARWAVLAPNAHKLGLVASAFVPIAFPDGPLHRLGMATFLLYDLLLNLPMVALVLAQRRVDARLERELEAMRAGGAAQAGGSAASRESVSRAASQTQKP